MQQMVRPASLDRAAPQGDAVSVRTITDLAGLDALAPDWLALEERVANDLTFFQSYAWCRAWIETFAADDDTTAPVIHTAWRGDRLVAVWPLMLRGDATRLRRLETLGEPHSQYSGIVCDPDQMDDRIAAALAAAVDRPGDCDVAVFMGVPATSPLARVLAAYPALSGYDNATSILDLSPYADSAAYTARLGKLQRRNRNRRRNHLARLGEVSFEVIWPDHPDFADLARRCTSMKREWLARSGRYSVGLAAAGHDAFLARLTGDSRRRHGACLSVLRVGDAAVALELGFVHAGHYYSYLGGFDWELRRLSPGKVQMDFTVAWLIDNGIGAYDLLGNPEDYKQSWSNRAVPLRAYAKPFSLRGRLYSRTWLPVLRPAAKRIYNYVPLFLRRLSWGAQSLVFVALHV
jgi:CelD/BcsL family acetyltransferase involved in cellulose biosynthesis